MADTSSGPFDDVDRLFARLEPIEPPRDFLSRVAAQTYARPEVMLGGAGRQVWLVLDLVALALLALLSINLGIAIHNAGVLELIGIALHDAEVFGEVGDVVEAFVESLPWPQIALLLVNVVAVAAFSRRLVTGGSFPTNARAAV